MKEKIEARLVWIPMDSILTMCVVMYYFFYLYLERKLDDTESDLDSKDENDDKVHEMIPYQNVKLSEVY